MWLFDHPEFDNHEKVLFGHDHATGLKAIIAIHDITRGPAVGGCRLWNYEREDHALTDVLRLSRGMSYKSALANLPFGGGKSVILGAPDIKSPALFRAMGRLVDSLGGQYRVAEDVGISVEDVEIMGEVTPHVAGTRAGGFGDPSPATARGVFMGLKAAVKAKLGRDDLTGLRVAVQGLGSVGYHLCRLLHAAGAKLIVTDIDREAIARCVEEFGADAVEPEAIYDQEVEIYAPCALGATIHDDTIPRLKASIVAGSANNQLAEERHGEALRQAGILYAPDYAINAGGVIVIAHETRPGRPAYDETLAMQHVDRIQETLLAIFERAEQDGIATSVAADRVAEDRLAPPLSAAAE